VTRLDHETSVDSSTVRRSGSVGDTCWRSCLARCRPNVLVLHAHAVPGWYYCFMFMVEERLGVVTDEHTCFYGSCICCRCCNVVICESDSILANVHSGASSIIDASHDRLAVN